MKTQSYNVTVPERRQQTQLRPEERMPQTRAHKLAEKIDKLYRDALMRTDLWVEVRDVERMIAKEYGDSDDGK